MRKTITVRLTEELTEWLENTAATTGISQGVIIREQLEKARTLDDKGFLHLAGRISGPRNLSLRKRFSTK